MKNGQEKSQGKSGKAILGNQLTIKMLRMKMTHKKIIRSCVRKLEKDAKHYREEEKEAKSAAKRLKKSSRKK
jgi:hypothetical protein